MHVSLLVHAENLIYNLFLERTESKVSIVKIAKPNIMQRLNTVVAKVLVTLIYQCKNWGQI